MADPSHPVTAPADRPQHFHHASWAVRFLLRLADAICHRPRWFLYPQLLLALVCVPYTIQNLEFHTSRNDLVGSNKEYHRIFLEFRKEFPIEDDLVVVVEGSNIEKSRQFVERLGTKMQRETNLFANVFYKGDLNMLGRKALLFLSESELEDLKQTLDQFLPRLQTFSATSNLVSLFDSVNTQIRTARREDTPENRTLVKALPALERILFLARDALQRSGDPPSPGLFSLFEGGKEAMKKMYITFNDGQIFLLTSQAQHDRLEKDAVLRLRALIEETQREVPGLNVGLTGEPVLEVDEMTQSQRDTTLATIVSLLLVALIFVFGYHETGRPLKATFVLVVGLIYTMGFTTLVIGHLNILTIIFVPILVGLAIDFGVHLITRYEEELWHGRSERVALEKAVVNTGLGIFTGAVTTAGAFFAMGATDFLGIREMGIICGGGMFLCLGAMMTLLPALLIRGRQNVLDHELAPVLGQRSSAEVDRRARLENVWLRRPGVVLVVVVLLSVVSLPWARRAHFDYNLLNMQSAGLPAVIFQDKLIETSPKSVLFAAVVAPSAVEATNLVAALTNLPTVASVDTMTFMLTEEQTRKLALIQEVKDRIGQVTFQPLDLEPVDVGELTQTLWSLHGYLNLALRELEGQGSDLEPELRKLRETLGRVLNDLRTLDRWTTSRKLARYQQAMFRDVHATFEAIASQDNREPMRVEDLPEAIRQRFVGITGKHLILVYPSKNVWNRQEQEEFVRELRTVHPRVTGTPVQLLEYTTLLKDSYELAAIYALSVIALLVWLHFWRVTDVILSLLPVFIGALWTLAVMGLLRIPFNPANIMVLPLIVGIGVTNGIHILNRFAEEQHPSILARSTGKAVLISGLTTIVGFGSLMVGQHRGIFSLGLMMAVGTALCMVVALTFLPALLNIFHERGWLIKKTQCDNAQSALGREEPR